MRAGSPWKAIRSPASPIQRANAGSSSGNVLEHRPVGRRDVGRVAADSATQRNGPLPSQNNGRM